MQIIKNNSAVKGANSDKCKTLEYSFNDKDIDLEQIFVNNSYLTGLNCELKKELKYFEF